jgi:hypothetical protein
MLTLPLLCLSLALAAAEPDLSKVRFYLWTRRNPWQHQEVWIEEEASIVDSCFDPEQPTVILAHGQHRNIESTVHRGRLTLYEENTMEQSQTVLSY